MTITTDDLLTLAQWLSPSFPIGAFSYSHGLEAAIETGIVTDAQSLQAWLRDIVQYGAGRNDVILLKAGYDSIAAADTLARALSPSRERLLETTAQGAAFVATVNAVWGLKLPETVLPVAVGAAVAARGLPVQATAQMYVHGFTSNLVLAATRLMPLGQTAAQQMMYDLKPLSIAVVDAALGEGLDALGSQCFAADIASMRHETLYSRMFRS